MAWRGQRIRNGPQASRSLLLPRVLMGFMISDCITDSFCFVWQYFANHETDALNQDTCVKNTGIIPSLLPPPTLTHGVTAEMMEKNS